MKQVVVPSNLGAEFALGTEVANKITIRVSAEAGNLLTNGADDRARLVQASLAPAVAALETKTTLTYDAATSIITYTGETGVPSTIDLSAFLADVSVSGGAYDPATQVLTLTQDDGGPAITINLQELKQVATLNSQTVTFTGNGENGTPLSAEVAVSSTAGNQLSAVADGLFVAPAVAPTYGATPSATLTLTGGVVTANVNRSATVGNQIVENADGLFVAPRGPIALDLEIQDAFGTVIGYASTTNSI